MGFCYDRETGLYYLQSRYYDPANGRFINADTIAGNTGNSTYNLFVYCGNNPIMKSDPTGLIGQTHHDFQYQQGYNCIYETHTTAVFKNSKGTRRTYGNPNLYTPPKGTICPFYMGNDSAETLFLYAQADPFSLNSNGFPIGGSVGIARVNFYFGSFHVGVAAFEASASASLSPNGLGGEASASVIKIDGGVTLFQTETHDVILTGEIGFGSAAGLKVNLDSGFSFKVPMEGIYVGGGMEWVPR